ncbi:MAG: PilZ domain-containing protein [Vulcanimicrobiota bacterium]
MLRNKIQGLEATDPDFPQLSLAERRKKLRVRTYIRMDLQAGASKSSAIITDLSLSGMRIRTSLGLKQGDPVEVAFPEAENTQNTRAIDSHVIWVTELGPAGRASYEVGLSFDESQVGKEDSWIRYVLEQLGFDESKTFQKRKYLRAGGRVPARIYTVNPGETITGEVLNLGVGGALLASETPLDKDTQIHCEICLWRILPPLRLPCKVMGVREDLLESEGSPQYLHSLLFLGMDTEQVKLLGNYVIHLINQCDDGFVGEESAGEVDEPLEECQED